MITSEPSISRLASSRAAHGAAAAVSSEVAEKRYPERGIARTPTSGCSI